MPFKPNPNLEAQLVADLEPRLERAGNVFTEQLRENVSAGPRSGRQYPDLPRQSSAPEEFLQEQSGAYKGAVENKPTSDPLRREVGVFSDVYSDDILGALEYGNLSGTLEGRHSLTRTMEDEATRRRALKAMRGP